jgi:hypothetical protein
MGLAGLSNKINRGGFWGEIWFFDALRPRGFASSASCIWAQGKLGEPLGARQKGHFPPEIGPYLLKGGSFGRKPAMRLLTGTSHILVPFPALRLAEARSDHGPSVVALETEACWIPPSAGARVRDPQRMDWNHRLGRRAISFLRGIPADRRLPGRSGGRAAPRAWRRERTGGPLWPRRRSSAAPRDPRRETPCHPRSSA